jgi:hypothetical protein
MVASRARLSRARPLPLLDILRISPPSATELPQPHERRSSPSEIQAPSSLTLNEYFLPRFLENGPRPQLAWSHRAWDGEGDGMSGAGLGKPYLWGDTGPDRVWAGQHG